jgi:hypothetical protein
MDMEIARTARFYQIAPSELLDKFEDALDADDVVLASAIREEFLTQADSPIEITKTAKNDPAFLSEDPEVGDMVFISLSNRHARLIAISDDRKIALVKEMFGAYTVPYDKLRRVR